ncbi:MAG: FMN-binding protein [Krumholzibacteria bacterium]|nr:FMN-binding protein [Candidatus Krumholzibacteria bacterium]
MDLRPLLLVLVGALALVAGVPAAWADDPAESPDGPEHVKVYFTEAEALARTFAGADSLWSEPWRPDPAERAALEADLGWHLPEQEFLFHRATRRGRDLGRALVLEEKGRFKPITFLVRVDPDGRVGQVLVMVYRESRGDAVRRPRFLKQFHGRDTGDPLRLNRDVVGISGATLSVRALAAGVRKALLLTAARYGGQP